MIRTSVLLTIALMLLPGCSWREASPPGPLSSDNPFPVRVAEGFPLTDPADIDAMLDQPVAMSELNERHGNTLVLRKVASNAEVLQAQPTTGREYLKLLADGYYADTTYAMTMESFFIYQAYSLVHLSYARLSATSYLATIRFDEIDPGTLPATLFQWGELPDNLPIQTLLDLDPGFEVESASPYFLSIVSQGGRHEFILIGWGDFNWDGVEDILVYHSFRAVGGTMRWYDHYILTRLSPNGDLIGNTWAKSPEGAWRIDEFGGEARRLRQEQAERRLRGAT